MIKIGKRKTSIQRLCLKSKSVVGTNLGLLLIGMLTHGHSTGGFGHFSLRFVHMGSQFTITSIAKCLRDLEDPHLDMYGDFLYESGRSTHFQMHYFKTLLTQNIECTRMLSYLKMEAQKIKILILNLFLHICCYSWTMQLVIIRIVMFSCFYHYLLHLVSSSLLRLGFCLWGTPMET